MIDYGNLPKDLGGVELEPTEMMYYLYLPIKLAGDFKLALPRNLQPFTKILTAACQDFVDTYGWENYRDKHYLYVTAKTMFVQPGSPGNREGWHADGYGSNGDINYIWANMNPTEFALQAFHDIGTDDKESMRQFEAQFDGHAVTYPNCTLLRLDESVVHRVSEAVEPGIRTFVKISFSRHQFNNKWNSHNYELDYDWTMQERTFERNLDCKEATV